MIIVVIYDMRSFLLLLFITIIAFGDSFLCIAYGNDFNEDPDLNKRFVTSFPGAIFYTYRMILGDFNVDAFGDVAVLLC